jgi:hypothetical protein
VNLIPERMMVLIVRLVSVRLLWSSWIPSIAQHR